ncbi:MAG: glycosyltransferase family 4 protein [Bacteroidota bacterium]|nr:glycosyltransferase family 4 protein [Bacteroidota bacterium]
MRIGMILDNSFPPDPRVENEAVSLIKEGHEVYLFSLCYNRNKTSEVIKGIQVKRYPAGKIIYKLSALAYTFPFYHQMVTPKISDFIRKNNIEILHIHDMVIAEAVFKVNNQYKLPVVLDLHENRPAIMRFYNYVNKFPGKYLINLDKWEKKQKDFLKKADKVILVTKEAKFDFVQKYNLNPKKIIAVPNTTITEIFYNYPIEQDIIDRFTGSFNILYLGDTGIRRGTDLAIKALALLKDKIKNPKLIFVGKSKEDIILKALAKELSVDDMVVFEGWQDLSKFPSYILASDVCISPLCRNIHHDTTYANKIFQYMAMGKPVVVSNCEAQAKVIEEENCGLVHEAGKKKDLADKIFKLYKKPALRTEMGNNARSAVSKKYNWSITSKELLKLYENLGEKFKQKAKTA